MSKTRHILTLLLVLLCFTTYGQSSNRNGLVDSRVTLDNQNSGIQKQPDNAQRQNNDKRKINPPATPGQADTRHGFDPQAIERPKFPASQDGAKISVSADTTTITVGEQTTLHLKVQCGEGQQVRFPLPKELNLGLVEIAGSSVDTLKGSNGGSTTIVQHLTVTCFDAGEHPLEGLTALITEGDKQFAIEAADSITLTVVYSSDADTVKCETKADAPYIGEPYTFWEIFRWVVCAIVIAAIMMGIVWVVRRRKENKPIIVTPRSKPAPADKRALSELENLRRKELWQKGRIKKYYTEMTDIVRRFLRNMYGIKASEMTSRQTLRAFHSISDWSEESEGLLRQLLQKADMVKFAKSQPESFEHDLAMQNAVDFVRKVAETHKINNPEKEEVK